MITEDFNNKLNTLFPGMTNTDSGNTVATGELWKGVSEKYADGVKKILAPIASQILDVQTDLQVRNPDACPVVQVEVIESMGDAMIDGENWDTTNIQNKYVDVKLHRVSRPFKLTAYDIMKGERIESKVKAAMETVAQGVFKLFVNTIVSANYDPSNYTPDTFGPEKCVELGTQTTNGANTVILYPSLYSKIVPTNGLGLDPKTEGVYGIDHIYKADMGDMAVATVAFERDGVAGAVATPEILLTNNGQGAQFLGEIAGVPMILISSFDYDTQTVKCSVETLAGFAVTDKKKVYSSAR